MRMIPVQPIVKPSAFGRTRWRCAGTLLLLALVAACATTQPAETGVKERAQARWDAVLAKDYDAAYTFYSPGYRSAHSRVDFEIYLRTRRVRWTSAEVQEASCEADVCTVETRMGYAVAGAVPGVPVWKSKRKLKETWVRTQGQWWFLPED